MDVLDEFEIQPSKYLFNIKLILIDYTEEILY